MSIYRRGKLWTVRVPTRSGQVARATGTSDRALARGMERMLELLGPKGRRDWELLDAVADDRITVSQLYDAYAANELEKLREQLKDIDLAEYLDPWMRSVEGRLSRTGGTAERYRLHVESLIVTGERFPRSELNHAKLTEWFSGLSVGPSTKRKYHAAMSSFCEYLRMVEVLKQNPMRDVQAPSAAPSRVRYLEHDDVLALVEAQAEPFRTLCALVHGTGLEISAALSLKRRDVDTLRREVRAKGTKNENRIRLAAVEGWAWRYLEAHIATLLPNADLFGGMTRWAASDAQRAACKALQIEDYRLHDARHTYAVRAIRAGASFEVVGGQLGHADTTMAVRVYGRFKPTQEEARDWERIAAAQDAERAKKQTSAS